MSLAAPSQVALTPLRRAASSSGTLDVVVQVQAPDQPTEVSRRARPPLRLALANDRSGSMSGKPLNEALRCAEYIASGQQRSDQVGVVLHDNEVHVALTMVAGGEVHAAGQALVGGDSGGTTALFDGWEAGAGAQTPEALLAFVVEGEFVEGRTSSSQSAVLSIPVVSPPGWAGLPADELVGRRGVEVGLAAAAHQVCALAAANDLKSARRLLQVLADQVQDVPWLVDKVRSMEPLMERSANLAANEMGYSSQCSAGRLAHKSREWYLASETDRDDIPAFLHRKSSEGESRKRSGEAR